MTVKTLEQAMPAIDLGDSAPAPTTDEQLVERKTSNAAALGYLTTHEHGPDYSPKPASADAPRALMGSDPVIVGIGSSAIHSQMYRRGFRPAATMRRRRSRPQTTTVNIYPGGR